MADTLTAALQINLLPVEQRARERLLPRISLARLVPLMVACGLAGGLGAVAALEERAIGTASAWRSGRRHRPWPTP